MPTIAFTYKGNYYDNFYLYPLPTQTISNQSTEDYYTCENYISNNPLYPMVPLYNRQARLHTCFSYCNDGPDSNMIPDLRPACADIDPSLRN